MNRLTTAKRIAAVTALTEGNSLASTCRMVGISKCAVLKLLGDVGAACEALHDRWVRDLPCKRVQVDEIWSFVGMKNKHVPAERRNEFGVGDVWTFVGLDADTKLVVAWQLGWRDDRTTGVFIEDLASRLAGRIQLTSDGFSNYVTAVDVSFSSDGVDYAQLIKNFGDQPKEERRRYSPSKFIGTQLRKVFGDPDEKFISTSYIERQNLNIRMFNRRMTRLTNAFSKKVENHAFQLALNFVHHNFCRIPSTLRCTPAMAAGIVSSPWDVADIVKVADEHEIMSQWPLAQAS